MTRCYGVYLSLVGVLAGIALSPWLPILLNENWRSVIKQKFGGAPATFTGVSPTVEHIRTTVADEQRTTSV